MIPINPNDIYDALYDEKMKEYHQEKDSIKWTMKDGSEIMLKYMKDDHIKNCIRMLSNRQTTSYRTAWIDIFNDELLNRRIKKIIRIKKLIYAKTIC